MKRAWMVGVLVLAAAHLSSSGDKPGKLQLELFTGYLAATPSDLNLIVDSEQNYNHFSVFRAYEYLQGINYIQSFSLTTRGNYRRIDHFFPLGGRLKWFLSPDWALSIGYKTFSRNLSYAVSEEYIIVENSGSQTRDTITYDPFQLTARGYSLLFGLHFGKNIWTKLRLEGFAALGPLSGRCGYHYNWALRQNYGDTGVDISNDLDLEMDGRGRGVALELGLQASFDISRRFSLFVEGAYVGQKVKNMTGPGRRVYYGYTETWEGKLAIKEDIPRKPWGFIRNEWPSNFWQGEEFLITRNMVLDLSGFRLGFGLIVKL